MTGPALAVLEAAGSAHPAPRRARRIGRVWLVLWVLALVWSVIALIDGQHGIVNINGWPAFTQFWAHALSPDLSAPLLHRTFDATLTTLAFAVLGTLLSVLLGLVGAPLMSQTWWASGGHSGWSRRMRAVSLLAVRVTMALPRGVHEAVWGLLLLSVLGRDPLVGVLAIAIPFGAITAKVYSELLDEADPQPYRLLRAAGAGRLSALCYGVLPALLPAIVSYGFYRFECAVRSAVILGMIGAGGLGLQLSLSFQGLQYAEMWTSIYALIVLSAVIDRWGAALRRGTGRRRWVWTGAALGGLSVVSLWHLQPDVSRWFSARTHELFGRLVDDLTPPALPAGGWPELLSRSVETLQMSLVAITLAAVAGLALALVAARGGESGPAARGGESTARRLAAWTARQVLLLTRAIPPPVWALLVLFVVFPGALPGALALGIYTFGILGRLFAEVVEELDPRPRDALSALGASPTAAFAYATVPAAARQVIAYSLYRWEVTARETVIVGVVGAGGLGRLLEQQRAAFDYPAMAGTVCALVVVVCVVVDLASVAIRSSLR